jgi:ABC-2 type transport system permease protein
MTRSYRAELAKLLRPRVVLVTAAVAVAFGVCASAIVLAAAEPASQATARGGRTPSLEALAAAGGGTEVFRVAASFTGVFLFVVFVGVTAAEFSRGTIRTMLIRQPRRPRLLAGKLAALLSFSAVTLAVAEAVTWLAARVQAPAAGVATTAWTSVDALGGAVGDFGAVLLWITGYAVLGTTVAVLLRSVPLALAVGIAWAGPVEHLLQDAWAPASRLFPGLLLEAFVAGGTSEVTASRALATVAVYTLAAAAVASVVFARRDVTT